MNQSRNRLAASLTHLSNEEFVSQVEHEITFIGSPYIKTLMEQSVSRLNEASEDYEAREQKVQDLTETCIEAERNLDNMREGLDSMLDDLTKLSELGLCDEASPPLIEDMRKLIKG